MHAGGEAGRGDAVPQLEPTVLRQRVEPNNKDARWMQIEASRGEHGWLDAMSLDVCSLLIQGWTRIDTLGPAFPRSRLKTAPQGLPSRGIP